MIDPNARHQSFWLDSTPDTFFPALEGELSVDVAVLGGGITGITAAWLLTQAGRSVAVVEAGRIVTGVTGYTTAKITSSHNLIYADVERSFGPEGARRYATGNQAAIELIAGLVADGQIDCDFERKANYVYSESSEQVPTIIAEVQAAARAGLPASFVSECSLPFPIAGAVRLENQAQFHPRKYLLHLANALTGAGSYVFEGTRATGVQEGSPCRVLTDKGTLTARDVIVATHMPILNRGAFFSKVHPHRAYAVAASMDPSSAPDGMFASTESPTHTARTSPYDGRALLIIGGEGHKTGQEPRTQERYERLEAWTRSRFDIQSIEYRWSTQDNYSIDRVPYIGKLRRGSRHVYVGTGYGGWGMTNGTLAAMILSDAIVGKPNPWAQVFDSNRLKPGTSAGKFTKENLNVAKRWIGDRLAPSPVRSLPELTPGRGAIVNVGGKKVAAYRDEGGALHAHSPVCTHMACMVHWNPAEKTWDCPCHGSRFSYEGDVIHGPAIKPLKKAEVDETSQA